jgi:hypothetical protein
LRLAATLVVLLTASASLLHSQQPAPENPEIREVRRVVHDASRALQGGNAASFLRLFDRDAFGGYAVLESHVTALTTQSDIASSIQIVEIEKSRDGYNLRIDWLLQLSVRETPAPLVTRHETVRISIVERRAGRWRITALEPVDFFRPQGTGQ